MFVIYFDGEAETLVNKLGEKAVSGELTRDERELYRKIRKSPSTSRNEPKASRLELTRDHRSY